MTFRIKSWVALVAVASIGSGWTSAQSQNDITRISMSDDPICVDQQLALDVVRKTGAPTGQRVLPILTEDGMFLATITRQQAIRENIATCSGQAIKSSTQRPDDSSFTTQRAFAERGSSSSTLP